jgi:hypothetical protein
VLQQGLREVSAVAFVPLQHVIATLHLRRSMHTLVPGKLAVVFKLRQEIITNNVDER